MHDGIDAAVLRLQCTRDIGKVLRFGDREIERQNRRLRIIGGEDPVVQRFQLAYHPAVKNDRGALRSAAHGENRAQSATRAGNQYYSAGEPPRKLRELRCGSRQRRGEKRETAGDDIGKHAMQSQSRPTREVETRIANPSQVCKRTRRVL